MLLDAFTRSRAQAIERPSSACHADDRHVERIALEHRLQRGKDLFEGEIAGRAEEHERIGMLSHLTFASYRAGSRVGATRQFGPPLSQWNPIASPQTAAARANRQRARPCG